MKTAVEWLVDKLKGKNVDLEMSWNIDLVKQAKEMEKQQIIEAKDCWLEDERDGEQYYNETFNK
jgi:hypothetical protein